MIDRGAGLIAEGEDIDEGGSSARNVHARMAMDRGQRGTNRLEAIARKYEEGGGYEDVYEDDEEYEGEDSAISQQSLLPSVRDPKLWMMTCKVGKEREIALTIMQKFIDKENAPDRLLVKSVVCPDHLKGHMYLFCNTYTLFLFIYLFKTTLLQHHIILSHYTI